MSDEMGDEWVLIGVDGSDLARDAAVYGLHLAASLGFRRAVALHVQPPADGGQISLTSASVGAGQAAAAELVMAPEHIGQQIDALREVGAGLDIEVLSREAIGSPAQTLVEEADGASLLVVGSHGRRGLRRLVLGSVAEWSLRHTGCPVLIHRGHDAWPPQRLLLGSDGSPDTFAPESWTARIAKVLQDSEVHVLTVVQEYMRMEWPGFTEVGGSLTDDMMANARHVNASLQQRLGTLGVANVTGSLRRGGVGRQMLAASRAEDLLVIGRASASWPEPFGPGKVAELLVRRLEEPLLVVPSL